MPANFAGKVGAFLAELSFQLLGYASFLIPAVIAVVGWHYFWCRRLDAVYTKLTGAFLLFACSSAFLSVTLGRVDIGPRAYRAGGYVGEWIGGVMAEYLNRTGSVIVLLAVMAGAVILATQFSFGDLFALFFSGVGRAVQRAGDGVSAWREERRKARQRREVLAKHGKTEAPEPARAPKPARAAERPAPIAAKPAAARRGDDDEEDDEPRMRATPPVLQKKAPPRLPSMQPLPLPEPDRCPRGAAHGRLHAAATDAARCRRSPSRRSTSAS